MNTEPTITGHDLTSFTPAFVPPAVSMVPTIESSAADTKRRLQMHEFTPDGAVSAGSPDVPELCADAAAVDASTTNCSPNASDFQHATESAAAMDTGDSSSATSLPETTELIHDTADDGLDATSDRDLVADCDVPDDGDSPAEALHPYWIPPGVDLSDWSEELLADVAALINPLYRDLVLLAPSALARSVGCTVVYLHWLEIIDQLEMGSISLQSDFDRLRHVIDGDPRQAVIDRYLRVVGAKLRFSQFLLQLQEIKSRHEKENHAESPRTSRGRGS